MKSGPYVDLSQAGNESHECNGEWQSVRTRRCNVLLVGAPEATAAALSLLRPHLREPIVRTLPGVPLDLERGMNGTVVLEAVSELGAEDQSRMLRWLDETNDRAQTISTTTTPLFPLVVRGLFDEGLYYRLNSVLLRVEAGQPAASSDAAEAP